MSSEDESLFPPHPKAEAFDCISLQAGPHSVYLRFLQQSDQKCVPTHAVSVVCSPHTAMVLLNVLSQWYESHQQQNEPRIIRPQ